VSLLRVPERASIRLASLCTACGEFPADASCRYSWECRRGATASCDSHDAEATPFPSIWPPELTRLRRQRPAFSCRHFLSPASQPAFCRRVSGSTDVGRPSPCPSAFTSSFGDTHLKSLHGCFNMRPVGLVPHLRSARGRTSFRCFRIDRRHLLFLVQQFSMFSRHE
jgi:hypothetical protein